MKIYKCLKCGDTFNKRMSNKGVQDGHCRFLDTTFNTKWNRLNLFLEFIELLLFLFKSNIKDLKYFILRQRPYDSIWGHDYNGKKSLLWNIKWLFHCIVYVDYHMIKGYKNLQHLEYKNGK